MSNRMKKDSRLYLPSCWEDEIRMKALFAIFRKKELNPTGWQEKMNFWINAINVYCQETKCGVISSNDIRLAFEKDKRYPSCVDDVFEFMINENVIETVENFSRSKNIGWLSWGFNSFVKTPISWGYSMIKGMMFEQQKEPKFVMFDIIKDFSQSILQKHSELVELEKMDNVVDYDALKTLCKGICNGESFDCALMNLQNEGEISIMTEGGKKFIRFKDEEIDVSPSRPECDKAVVKLRTSLQAVSNEIDTIEKEIDVCTDAAKQFVRQGSKSKAMALLKKRKRLEVELKRKTTSMDNLETLLSQIKNSASEKKVLQAYNAGVIAMKSCLTNDLDLNKIDDTMADIEEVADDINELETILSRGLNPNPSLDDELERELSEIMAEDSEDVEVIEENSDEELMKRLAALRSPVPIELSPISNLNNASRVPTYRNQRQRIAH